MSLCTASFALQFTFCLRTEGMAPLSPHSLWVVGPHIALRKGNTAVLPSASRVSSHPSHFLPCHQLAQAFSFFLNVFFFLQPHPRQPRLRVKSKLQLPAYTIAIAMLDPRRVCNLYHSSKQCWILNPLNEARD